MSNQPSIKSFFTESSRKRSTVMTPNVLAGEKPLKSRKNENVDYFNLDVETDTKPAIADTGKNKNPENRNFVEKWKLKYFVVKSKDNKPQCLLCTSVLAQAKDHNCKTHYNTHHKEKFEKKFPLNSKVREDEFNRLVEEQVNLMQQAKKVFNVNHLTTKASFEVAWKLCRYKKPFADCTFIKDILVTVHSTIYSNEDSSTRMMNQAKIRKIPISRKTITKRVKKLSMDVEFQLKSDLKNCLYFSFCLDDSKDITDYPQLITFVRYVTSDYQVKEEMLFLCQMKNKKRGEDIYKEFKLSVDKFELDYSKLTGITTDGCPAMKGPKIGFVATFLSNHRDELTNWVCSIHCFVHQEAIAAKLLDSCDSKATEQQQPTTSKPTAGRPKKSNKKAGNLKKKPTPEVDADDNSTIFKDLMKDVTRLINYLRSGDVHRFVNEFLKALNDTRKDNDEPELPAFDFIYYCEVRWLSRGKVLTRVCQLLDEVVQFVEENGQLHQFPFIKDQKWIRDLYFLTDMTNLLADLNKKIQGKDLVIQHFYDKIKSFQLLLKQLPDKIKNNDFIQFDWFKKIQGQIETADIQTYANYLVNLSEKFDSMFKEFSILESAFDFYQIPFEFDPSLISSQDQSKTNLDTLQSTFSLTDQQKAKLEKEIFALKGKKVLKKNKIIKTWKLIFEDDDFEISKQIILKLLSLFGSTYICECTFSILHFMKNKFRNLLSQLNLENEMRCALTSHEPDFEKLSKSMQNHPSHTPKYSKQSDSDSEIESD